MIVFPEDTRVHVQYGTMKHAAESVVKKDAEVVTAAPVSNVGAKGVKEIQKYKLLTM